MRVATFVCRIQDANIKRRRTVMLYAGDGCLMTSDQTVAYVQVRFFRKPIATSCVRVCFGWPSSVTQITTRQSRDITCQSDGEWGGRGLEEAR